MNKEGRLNASEKRVLQLIHLPNKLIAQKMCISVSTVKTYICNLLNMYKQKTRTGLLLKAIKLGYVDIHKVDIGFWDENGEYIENMQEVDFGKEIIPEKEQLEILLKNMIHEMLPKEIRNRQKLKKQVMDNLNNYIKLNQEILTKGESIIKTYQIGDIEVRDYKKEEQA